MSVIDDSYYQFEHTETNQNSGNTRVAIVSDAALGEALQVVIKGLEHNVSVISHAVAVPSLNVADEVVVLFEGDSAIILQKLRSKGQRPQQGFIENEDGSLSLNAKQSLVIKTQKAVFEINADGQIKIEGEEIFSVSKGVQYILGSQLNLN